MFSWWKIFSFYAAKGRKVAAALLFLLRGNGDAQWRLFVAPFVYHVLTLKQGRVTGYNIKYIYFFPTLINSVTLKLLTAAGLHVALLLPFDV